MSKDGEKPTEVPCPPPIPDVSNYPTIKFYQHPKGKRFLKELQFKLVGAIESNNAFEVAKLIHKGVDVNCIILIHKTPLIYAIERRSLNPEIPVLLLQAGGNVELPEVVERRRRPIHVAVMTGSLTLVQNLLEFHARIDGRDGSNMTALHYASYYGFQDIASELIAREPRHLIHFGDITGRTAIHRAIESKHYDVAEMLYQKGADINIADINGWTPLFQCIIFNNITSVKYLLNRNASVNIRDKNGNTPLHAACNPLGKEYIRIVSSTSMDYYKRTRRIPTPELQSLFILEQIGCLKTVQIIVNAGADVSAVNDAGANPIHHTKVADIVKYLLACGTRLLPETLVCLSQAGETEFVKNISSSLAFLEQNRLMRQCRNVIRKRLSYSRNIQKAVSKLPLPGKLQDYVNLVDYDTQ